MTVVHNPKCVLAIQNVNLRKFDKNWAPTSIKTIMLHVCLMTFWVVIYL